MFALESRELKFIFIVFFLENGVTFQGSAESSIYELKLLFNKSLILTTWWVFIITECLKDFQKNLTDWIEVLINSISTCCLLLPLLLEKNHLH